MFRHLTLWLIAASATPALAQADVKSIPIWDQAGWVVSEVHLRGGFTGCHASKNFREGESGLKVLLMHMRGDRWWGALSGDRIKAMPAGAVELIANGTTIVRASTLPEGDRSSRDLGTLPHSTIDVLIAAEDMTVSSVSDRVTIPLAGSEDALKRTTQCVNEAVAREVRLAGISPPPLRYRALHVVSQNVVNMRLGPSMRAQLIVAIPAGERRLEVIDGCRRGDTGQSVWCHVRWSGQIGWVAQGGLIQEVAPTSSPRDFASNDAPPRASPPPAARQEPSKQEPAFSSGSGFFISKIGHVLTNAHVIAGCKEIGVSQPGRTDLMEARLLARDRANDLALLRVTEAEVHTVAALRLQPRLGEDVAVFGYPLAGTIASSGNFTKGTISALAGLQDDTTNIQITAPIQPGNSGGPVLDQFGNVVAVVVARLSSKKVEGAQQVNFAIKASAAMSFLESNNQLPVIAPSTQKLDGPDLADQAKRMSAFILCAK